MKATTFVSGHNRRIAERVARLSAQSRASGQRAACLPAVAEVVEEVLSLIAIEEDLFYPALASIPGSVLAPARLSSLRGELARIEASLHGVMGATDVTFVERVAALEDATRTHSEADDALLPLAEHGVDASVLDELGARMERFYVGSVAAAHGPASRVRP
jgi:hypothetical protein